MHPRRSPVRTDLPTYIALIYSLRFAIMRVISLGAFPNDEGIIHDYG